MNTKRTLAYLLSLVLSTIFFSCQSDCECGENPYRTDLIFTNIKTTSVDNSGNRFYFEESEEEATTIPYKAIGLRVAVTDTVKREIVANVDDPTTVFHCTNWYGGDTEIDCDWFRPAYIIKKKVSALRIVTLYDFSPEYPAGTEISSLFKASMRQFLFNGELEEFLYTEMDSAIQYFHRKERLGSATINFDLVLAQPALCDSMLLEISVEFDDNSALTDTTNTIYPIK